MEVRAIVLSGGDSSRMGSPKALLDHGGRTFLETILARLAEAGIADRTVVLGKHAPQVKARVDLAGVRVVVNADPSRGQLSSLQEALRAIAEAGSPPASYVVCLVDHPSVSADTYRRLAAKIAASPGAVVLTRFRGKHGHPVAFGADRAAAALQLAATAQMREVLKATGVPVLDLEVEDDGVRWDVDTPDDYRNLVGPALTDGQLVDRLGRTLHSGRAAALVTVIDTVGSSPRPVGTKMVVHADGTLDGTIGGGTLEALAIREALLALDARKPRKVRFNLGATGPRSIGMFCGGEVEVFIDVVQQPIRVLLLGAGHVNERLARVCEVLGLRYAVADDRDEFASRERYPMAEKVLVTPLPDGLEKLEVDASTYVVIATRCHTVDLECLARLLESRAPYLGMIGSITKVRQVFKLLRERGIDAERDPRVYAPVGLALGTSEPGAIAVSVLAEVLKVHHQASGASLRDGTPVKRAETQAPEVAASLAAGCAVPQPKKEGVR